MSVRYLDSRRAAKRLSWGLLLTIGVVMTVSLYYVKTQAQTAKKEVRQLERSINQEIAAIKVLEAERAYLMGPERLQKLSDVKLGLEPITPDTTSSLKQGIEAFPLREKDVILTEGEVPDVN